MQRRAFIGHFTIFLAVPNCLVSGKAVATSKISSPQTQNINFNYLPSDHMDNHARKEVVKRFNKEVIEEGNRASFEALMDTRFINHSAPPGTANDAESMWNTFQHILRPALSDLQVQIHDQLCEGEKVTTRKSITGKHTGSLLGIAATGKSISIDVIDIVHVQDGRYLEHWGINTLSAVLAQLRAH